MVFSETILTHYHFFKFFILQIIQKLFRHGDRNIIHTYPNDPWKDESNWPAGFGQLTNVSKNKF